MAVLDASALVAAFLDEPARSSVEPFLDAADARMSAVNLVEVYDLLMRGHDRARNDVDTLIDTLRASSALTIVPLSEEVAARAGELRATHYHRTRRPVSLADCAVLATAEALREPVVTTDAALAAMANDVGVEVVEL